MLISEIRLMDQTATPQEGLQSATVVLTSETGQFCLRAGARLPDGTKQADITQALVDDALRQIARLPEYRGGGQSIRIAEGAMPGPNQGA